MALLNFQKVLRICLTKIMNDDFAVFIMVWGRPEKMWTAHSLRKQGYTGKIFYVADDLDVTLPEYKAKYGDDLLVFSKVAMADEVDPGDNSGDLRSTMYAVNAIQRLAKENGIKYFFIMCDDYKQFDYRFDGLLNYVSKPIKNLNSVFELMLTYFKNTNALSIAMSQTGDFIGGKKGSLGKEIKLKRKAMNSFLCSTDRPFQFIGRMNEDVTTYVNLGQKGCLFLTVPNTTLYQCPTQSEKGGLSEMYLDYGTYVKSFFTVMYNPSCVKVGEMGEKHKRLHHKVKWRNAVPCILSEQYRKVSRVTGETV
jgi:hypothetical protein